MNDEHWKYVEQKLSVPYGSVKLVADGYDLSLVVSKVSSKRMTFGIVVYIDGTIKPDDFKETERSKKFYRRIARPRYSKKYMDALYPTAALRRTKEYKKDKAAVHAYYAADWVTFKRMKSHFIKNNTSIELSGEEDARYQRWIREFAEHSE